MISTTQTGMVINSINSLDSETKQLLNQNMPNIDVANAMIFHSGRTPSGALKYIGFLLGGLILLLLAFAWILFVHS